MRKALTDVQRKNLLHYWSTTALVRAEWWKRFRLKNFKYATAYTELSRIRNCTKEGTMSKKPSITEVQILPPEQLEDSLNFFYELGKDAEDAVKQ